MALLTTLFAANDSRRCTIPNEVNLTRQIDAQARNRDVFNQIGKIGNIDALKDFGATSVGKGATFLARMSDVIGSGASNFMPGENGIEGVGIPSFIGKSLEAGATAVGQILDPAGKILSNLDPAAINGATNELKNVYQRVKQGGFKLKDAPQALETILAAEKNITGQLNKFFGKKTANTKATIPIMKDCSMAIPYAVTLGSTHAPKTKFLFVVQFEFHPELISGSNNPYNLRTIAYDAAFLIKTASRPNYNIEYEDVNMYNYRTKIAKALKYENNTFVLYDDNRAHVHKFFTAITRILNPISNMSRGQAIYNEGDQFDIINGTDASQSTPSDTTAITDYYNFRAGSVAALNVQQMPFNIFKQINLYHVYDYGKKCTVYQYIDPQIARFQLSNMDMADSEPADITMEFSYNMLRVQEEFPFPGTQAGSMETPDFDFNIQDNSDQVSMPIGGDRAPAAGGGEVVTAAGGFRDAAASAAAAGLGRIKGIVAG